MTKTSIVWAAVAVLTLALVATAAPAFASKEIAATEGMSCTACHDKPGSIRLTNRGKFYELMGSFEAYDELSEKFGACTTCHKRRPGSTKLTAEGKKFKELHGGMETLCADVLKERSDGAQGDARTAPVSDDEAGSSRRLLPSH